MESEIRREECHALSSIILMEKEGNHGTECPAHCIISNMSTYIGFVSRKWIIHYSSMNGERYPTALVIANNIEL